MLVFGWFYLSPVDYPRLGKDVASSLGFLSNFFYAREFGYFEQGIHEKWLLHTWSLSVEWQFYIIFPIALLILKTFFPCYSSSDYSSLELFYYLVLVFSPLTASDEQLNKNPHRCMIGQADKTESLKQCYIGNKDNIKALVIGDSHADSVTTALTSELDLKAEGAVTFIRANCPFVINAKDNRNSDICYEENFSRLEQAKNYAGTPIIIISRWTAYIYGQSDPKRIRNGDNRASMYFGEEKYMAEAQLLQEFSKNLTTTLCSLPKTSPKFIMQPVPEMGTNVPATMTKALLFGEENIDLSIEDDLYYARNSNIRRIISDAATTCKAVVLDPSEILCQKGRCIADINGRPIYFDGDHLNEFGNKLLTPLFNKYF